jgi:fibronectin type 3 domain-containing protein
MRIFRVEDGGTGEPKAAMLVDGRIAGYEEVAVIRGAESEPAVRRGPRLEFTDRRGLAYGRRYTYVVVAGDPQGRIGPPSHRVSVSYAAAPAEPANLTVEPSDSAVRLTWSAPARRLDGSEMTDTLKYEVLRASSADAELAPVTAPVSESALTDAKLENDRAYYYAVRAVRVVAGTMVYGRATPPVAVTPRDTTPPSAPRDLVGIASVGTARLSWSPSPEADVAGYIVYRAPVGGAFERIGSTSAPATTYVDRAVPRGTYRYAVTAQDTAARPNESPRSNEVRVGVP